MNGEEERELAELRDRYAIAFTQISFLRESGARCFLARADGRKYLWKRIKPAFAESAGNCARALRQMERSGVGAPRPVPTARGETLYESGGTTNMLLNWIEGSDVEDFSRAEAFGAEAGKMHARASADGLSGRDEEYYFGRYARLLSQKGYPREKLSFFREYAKELWERLRGLPQGFCHGDMHRGNALIGADGRAYFLDFDTACRSFFSFDIAVFCDATDYFTYRREGLAQTLSALERFLSGYRRYREPTPCEIRAVPDWIAARHFEVQATILTLFGLDCVDEAFIDRQRIWLTRWREQTGERGQV